MTRPVGGSAGGAAGGVAGGDSQAKGAPPIRVLVVDDSSVIRRVITDILKDDPTIEVAGTAHNGQVAVRKVAELNPDVVTMDVEMPEMNGIEAVRAIRRTHPRLPIVMFSTITERGAAATLDALAAGATDYVTKPTNVSSIADARAHVQEQLVAKVKALAPRRAVRPPGSQPGSQGGNQPGSQGGTQGGTRPGSQPGSQPGARSGTAPGTDAAARAIASAGRIAARGSSTTSNSGTRTAASAARPAAAAKPVGFRPRIARPLGFGVLAIGCSTGGPDALATVLSGLPADLAVPVVIVQHMPPLFTRMLAERLDTTCHLRVSEAVNGDAVVPGRVLMAPGGQHMTIEQTKDGVVARLNDDPPENYCRPAVDVLFRSVAKVYADRTLAVVLTGMGRDGEKGAVEISRLGGEIVVQDELTSVVWGMPGAVAQAGVADRVVPLPQIGTELIALLRPGRAATGTNTTAGAR